MNHVNKEIVKHIDLIIRNLGDNGPSLTSSSSSSSSSKNIRSCTTSCNKTNSSPGKNNKRQKVNHRQDDQTELLSFSSDLPPCVEDNNNKKDNSNCNDLMVEFHHRFAPVGLESQYHELYLLLEKGLIGVVDYNTTTKCARLKKTNVAALLMGPRGEGKSLVLERCLLALEQRAHDEQAAAIGGARFRVVRLNGILLRGENVAIVVQEIVRQLCEIVTQESCLTNNSSSSNKSNGKNNSNDNRDNTSSSSLRIQEKLQQLMQKQAQQFRSKVTTFNSTMACLNEAFQISCIDSIPILIVLEELDSFLPAKQVGKVYRSDGISGSSSNIGGNSSNITGGGGVKNTGADPMSSMFVSSPRDLLLYHLLDRIAGKGSLISLVGTCSKLTTTESYEKRVRSRAQGTSTVLYFNLYPAASFKKQPQQQERQSAEDYFYLRLLDALMSNFDIEIATMTAESTTTATRIELFIEQLKDTIQSILSPPPTYISQRDQDESTMDEKYKIYNIFRINRELGKSIRWFCRVLSIALAIYCSDIQENHHTIDIGDENCTVPLFNESYLIESLQAMGADHFVSEPSSTIACCFDTGPTRDGNTQTRLFNTLSPRENDLISLSGCQVAILVSAKRIMERDFQSSENDSVIIQKPITFERIRREYESHFVMKMKSNGPDFYSEIVFFKAFLQMLGRIFFVEKDHTESGPNQYYFCKRYTLAGMHPEAIKKTPLHVGVDMERDVMALLLAGKLNCSMAVMDWAKVNFA